MLKANKATIVADKTFLLKTFIFTSLPISNESKCFWEKLYIVYKLIRN